MKHIIGKLIFIGIIAHGTVSLSDPAATFDLKVTNSSGIPLSSVTMGMPFTVSVIVKNGGTIEGWPTIEGIEKVQVIGRQTQSRSNGPETEVRFSYTVLAENPGQLTIGPAVSHDGKNNASAQTITVLEAKQQKKADYKGPFYALTVKHKSVFIGERLSFSIRFLWQDPETKLSHLEMPHGTGFEVSKIDQGQAKSERIDNELYQVIEYHGYLIPEKIGVVTIPRLRADFTIPSKEPWGSFFGFITGESKAVFSDQVSLHVQELPPTKQHVLGVGNFSHFEAALSSTQAPQSEAVILTLSVQSDADIDKTKTPVLRLPKELKWYESKSSTSVIPQGEMKKWEFIIQGLKEGIVTIPAQEFTYFDTKKKAYRTLKSAPLTLTITPGRHIIKEEKPRPAEPHKSEGPPPSTEPFALPLPLFIVLMLLPVILRLVPLLCKYGSPFFNDLLISLRSRVAVVRAKRKLKRLLSRKKAMSSSDLYYLMKKTVIERFALPSSVNDDEIELVLREHGFDQEALSLWSDFVRQSLSYTKYAPASTSMKNLSSLGTQALTLLDLLNKKSFTLFIFLSYGFQIFSADTVQSILFETVNSWTSLIPFGVWQVIVLTLWWCIWFGILYLPKALRVLMIGTWLFIFMGWAVQATHIYRPRAVVMGSTIPLYVGPDESYPIRGLLEPLQEVGLAKKEGQWYYVTSSQGNGWVRHDHVTLKKEERR